MNRVTGVFRMHWRDKLTWLYLPWGICLFSFVVNLVTAAFIQETVLYTGGIATIFVYLFVSGIVVVAQTFSFTLGMGVRRTDYFLGTLVLAVWVSLFSTAALIVLSLIEGSWYVGWGVGLHFFNLPFIHDGPILGQAVALFVLMLNQFYAGFGIASIYRKFGKIGMFVFFTLVFLIFAFTPLLITYYDGWVEVGRWIEANFHSMIDLTPWLLLLTALYAIVSYGLLRRSTV